MRDFLNGKYSASYRIILCNRPDVKSEESLVCWLVLGCPESQHQVADVLPQSWVLPDFRSPSSFRKPYHSPSLFHSNLKITSKNKSPVKWMVTHYVKR